MKTKTHKAMYQPRLPKHDKLNRYFIDANKGASTIMEFLLNLFGGIQPHMLKNAIYTTAKKKDQDDDEDEDDEKELAFPFPNMVLLFYNWFTLEDIVGADPEISTAINDVIPKFKEYLLQENIIINPKWLETIAATIASATFHPGEGSYSTQILKRRQFLKKVFGKNFL